MTSQKAVGWNSQRAHLLRGVEISSSKMKGAHFMFVSVWVGIWVVTGGLLIPRALHAPTISLEEYGVVLKPGRIMSTADITHVQQGF